MPRNYAPQGTDMGSAGALRGMPDMGAGLRSPTRCPRWHGAPAKGLALAGLSPINLTGLTGFSGSGICKRLFYLVNPVNPVREINAGWRTDGWQGRQGWPRLQMLHLDVENLHPIGNLPGREVEQAGGLGLHPAGLFESRDDLLAFVQAIQIEIGGGGTGRAQR